MAKLTKKLSQVGQDALERLRLLVMTGQELRITGVIERIELVE